MNRKNAASEYGASFKRCGLECVFVTPKSEGPQTLRRTRSERQRRLDAARSDGTACAALPRMRLSCRVRLALTCVLLAAIACCCSCTERGGAESSAASPVRLMEDEPEAAALQDAGVAHSGSKR